MVATWTLVVGIIAAVASLIAAVAAVTVTLLSLQEKRRKELPWIDLYGAGEGGIFYCHLKTNNHSIGWKIRRVDVKECTFSLSTPIVDTLLGRKERKYLAQPLPPQKKGNCVTYGSYSEWRDFCEWSKETALYEIAIHDYCGSALLSFTCEMPSRKWWNLWQKKIRVPFPYKEGTKYPILCEHPALKNL